ncbi:hypothetical protein BDR05DRAFT_968986 [Suillus weaverae]|nr:hypothetical protein BDR05DRAFT_968986 [Suillus weaverae]
MTSFYIIMDYTCETDGTYVSIGMSHNCSLAYIRLHTIFVKRDGTTPNHNLGMI